MPSFTRSSSTLLTSPIPFLLSSSPAEDPISATFVVRLIGEDDGGGGVRIEISSEVWEDQGLFLFCFCFF